MPYIHEFTELTDPNQDDILIIVDDPLGANVTKKVKRSKLVPQTLVFALGDETSPLEPGVAKVTFRMPFSMTLTSVKASLSTAASDGTCTFDINKNGTSILSTKISIRAGSKTSLVSDSPVFSDTNVPDDSEMTIDVDTAGIGAVGAKIYISGHLTGGF